MPDESKKGPSNLGGWDQSPKPSEPSAAEKAAFQARVERMRNMKVSSQRTVESSGARNEKIADIEEKLGIEDPQRRAKIEGKVLETVFQDGGISVHTSMLEGLSDFSVRKLSGFQDLESRMQDGRQTVALSLMEGQFMSLTDSRSKRLDDALKERGIREIIDIRREQKSVHERVVVPGKKGFLGIGKTEDKIENKDTGRTEVVFHNKIVSGGKSEPATRFTYYIPSSPDWTDYSGRGGQQLVAELVLPESAAKELVVQLDQNPAFMRTIIEKFMKEKLLKDPTTWEASKGASQDSLKPPYERWDQEAGGGKIYVQKEGGEPGFHETSWRNTK